MPEQQGDILATIPLIEYREVEPGEVVCSLFDEGRWYWVVKENEKLVGIPTCTDEHYNKEYGLT